MKKILIPVDSSENAEKAVAQGRILAEKFDSDVVLLYVVGLRIAPQRFGVELSHVHEEDPAIQSEKKGAEKLLADYKASFGNIKGTVETKVLQGSITDHIISTINNTDIDFVIMGSHGIGSTLYRTILGSVTNKVIHNSTKPVLVVR